jgi:hypothetical protein
MLRVRPQTGELGRHQQRSIGVLRILMLVIETPLRPPKAHSRGGRRRFVQCVRWQKVFTLALTGIDPGLLTKSDPGRECDSYFQAGVVE